MSIADRADGMLPGRYNRVEPVDRDKHRNLGISTAARNRFASGLQTSPLNMAEFFHAMMHYPIAFVKHDSGAYAGRYSPCAVMGIAEGQNLFMDDDGGWPDGFYCPAYIRRYPFVTEDLSEDEISVDTALEKPVYVDAAGLEKEGDRLFDANGHPLQAWNETQAFISDYLAAERVTLAFTRKLDALGLFEAFDAQIHPRQGDMVRLRGLHRVNENRLNRLPANAVTGLMQSGRLSRIYAHLISLENFAKLLDRSVKKKL